MIWKVAYVSWTGEMFGGGEQSLAELLEALDADKVRPILVAPENGGLTLRCRLKNIPVDLFAFPPSLMSVANGTVFRFSRWLKENKIDLVHGNSAGRTLLVPAAAAKLAGIPFIWHARIVDREPVGDAIGAGLSARIIATSQYIADRRFPSPSARRKVAVIPNPIDTEAWRPNLDGGSWRKRFGFKPDDVVTAAFGRLHWEKRLDVALRAVASARSGRPNLRFAVIGDGPQRAELERLSQELGIQDAVVFTGHEPNPGPAMAGIDILMHPMTGEGFGRVCLEAMACGKPVVAAADGGQSEIVEDGKTGILIHASAPEKFAAALGELAQSPAKRAAMGMAGLARAREAYAAPRIAERVVQVYEEQLK